MNARFTAVLFGSLLALASAAPASETTTAQSVKFDHVHLGVPDPAKTLDWYEKLFGGQRMPGPDRLVYGATRLDVAKTETPQPSAGSLLDNIGFAVVDVDATVKAAQADGAKVVEPARNLPGLYKRALIEDPWGTRIEVVQDPQHLGFHHVHMLVPNPTATLQWYAKQFGGKVTKMKGKVEGIDYDGMWLLAERGNPPKPSRGHAIDHLGFNPPDVNSLVANLKAQNVKITVEPREVNNPGRPTVHIGFIEDSDGIGIELIQRQ